MRDHFVGDPTGVAANSLRIELDSAVKSFRFRSFRRCRLIWSRFWWRLLKLARGCRLRPCLGVELFPSDL
jgi:hypothetical protein